MTNMNIRFAETDEEIAGCHSVMSQLRPHISYDDFLPQVKRQMATSGFQLSYLENEGEVQAVAGIRLAEWLPSGLSLEIEDLVAAENERSKGYGGKLFDWIVGYAREKSCSEVRLISNVTRHDAHRFYLKKRMKIDAYFFALPLEKNE